MTNGKFRYFATLFFILLAAGINYGISFLITPFITERLGAEAYGFVSIASNFANYASVITVAINSVATRYIAVEVNKNDYLKANQYYTSLFLADIFIDLIIFFITFIFVLNITCFLKISDDLISDVQILFITVMSNFCIISAGTVFNTATMIKNRLDISAVIKIIAYVVNAIILVCLFKNNAPHVFYVGFGLIGTASVLFIGNYLYSKKTIKSLSIRIRYFSVHVVRDVLLKGIWYSINSLGNILNSGLDLWITNLMLSPFEMGELAIVKTVSTIGTALYQLAAQPLQPLLLKFYSCSDKENLRKQFTFGIKVNGYFANIIFAFFIAFGTYYYQLWTPTQDTHLLYSLTIIVVVGGLIEGTVTPLFYSYVLTLKNKIPCIITLISGALNLISMYILIKYAGSGLHCVVGTTMVITWIGNAFFNPIYSAYCLGLKWFTFYPALIRSMISGIITMIFCLFLRVFFNPESWIILIVTGIICCIIGGISHLLIALNQEERKRILYIMTRRK